MTYLPPIYRKLGILFLAGVFFHTLTRLTFYLWNLKEFSNIKGLELLGAFIWGLRFDISATATFLVPAFLVVLFMKPWLPGRALNWVIFISFTVLMIPALALCFTDIEMVNLVGRRFTWGTLFILKEAPGKGAGFFKDYGGMMVFVVLLLTAFTWKLKKWAFQETTDDKSLLRHFSFGLIGVVLMVLSIRGGLQLKPLNFTHSQVYASSWLNNLIINSSFSIIKSANQETLPSYHFFSTPEERLSFLNGSLPGPSRLEGLRPSTPQNVVIIIMESFSLEYMGKIHGDTGYTPFLDSLAEKSLFFSKAVANGRRSIEGVPAILTGVPTLMNEPFITSPYASHKIMKLPDQLKSRGYHTSFFHGGHNGTMYFDSFTKGLGFDHYFGASEYPDQKDYDGTWGIYDEPFFQFFAQRLGEFPQPFLSAIFSLSSHQPYSIPASYEKTFPEGPIPILKAVAYSDYALKKFFEKIQGEPWYHNTLFVITADHTQMSYRKDYKNDVSKYRIPILFFHPQFQWPKIATDEIVQQIDIPLSILDFLGVEPQEVIPLDQSVFVEGDKSAVVFLDGKYFLIAKDYFLTWLPGHEAQMFASADVFQDHALDEPKARKELLTQKLRASVEFHNNGMLENRLTVPLPVLRNSSKPPVH